MVENIFAIMDSNRQMCMQLAKLRDALLPKLISGEIDVSRIDLTQLNGHLAACHETCGFLKRLYCERR